MKENKINKTNAARLLDKAKIAYELIPYEVDEKDLSAIHVATSLGEDIEQVFKTLILHGDKPVICVRHSRRARSRPEIGRQGVRKQEVRPYPDEGTASADGVYPRRLFAYRHEKPFPTYIHETCLQFSYIYISAGQRGLQLKLNPKDLIKEVHAEVCRLLRHEVCRHEGLCDFNAFPAQIVIV